MANPTIPTLPTPPNRNMSQTEFTLAADAFLAALPNFGDSQNDLGNWMNTTAEDTNTLAQSSSALNATILSSTNFKRQWTGATGAYTTPATFYHNGSYWQMLVDIPDITLSEPSLVNPQWAASSQSAGRTRVLSPFTLTIPGRYYIIGSDIITIPDPATLDDGIAFDFVKQPTEQPTVYTGVDNTTTKLGLSDGILMDMSQVEMVTNNNLYEV